MPVTLIRGPIDSGKTTYLLNILKEKLPRRTALFVTPAKSTSEKLRAHLLEDKEIEAILGNAFCSWTEFLHKLAGAPRFVLSPLKTVLLLHNILTSHRLKYFHRQKTSLSLARQFTDTILALKQNAVGPDKLRFLLETRGSLKENDLLTVFEKYESQKIKNGLIDNGDLLPLALNNLGSSRCRMLKDIDTICIDEFHHFHPGEILILKAIRSSHPKISIAISHPTSANKDELFYEYLGRGNSLLTALADNVVELKGSPSREPEIRIFKTRSITQEARFAASLFSSASGSPKEDMEMLVTIPGTPFFDYFLQEIRHALGNFERFNESISLSAPIIHKLLAINNIELWPKASDLGSYCKILREYIGNTASNSKWIRSLAHGKEERAVISRSLNALIDINSLISELEIASEITALPEIDRDDFVGIVAGELLDKRGTPHFFKNILPFEISDITVPLSVSTKSILIPQMIDGIFPRFRSERIFFSEADRFSAEPDTTLDDIFPSIEDILAEQAYIFETYTRKTSSSLTITMSAAGETGTETAPSQFLDNMPAGVMLDAIPPLNFPDLPEHLANHMGNMGQPEYNATLTSPESLDMIRDRFTREKLSPTRLERYAECPFRFYAEKVLGLKPVEEETPELQPKDRGNLIHYVFERFYMRCMEDFRKAVTDAGHERHLKKIIGELLDEVIAENGDILSRTARGLHPLQRSTMFTMIWQVIRMELGLARNISLPLYPKQFEWAFGTSAADTLKIPIDGESPALVGGRIDRIDTDDNDSRFLIIDYKTGSSVGPVKNEIMHGLHLQLPLYIEAARRFLYPNALPLGGLLIGVLSAEKKHGIVKREYNNIHYSLGRAHSAVSDDAWDEAIGHALAASALYVASIRKGIFAPTTRDNCPGHCDYEDICRSKNM